MRAGRALMPDGFGGWLRRMSPRNDTTMIPKAAEARWFFAKLAENTSQG